MNRRWVLCVTSVSDAKQVKESWRWIPLPPLEVIQQFLKGYNCFQCRKFTGPFLFIGRYPGSDKKWVGFQKPILFLRNGDLCALLKEMSTT